METLELLCTESLMQRSVQWELKRGNWWQAAQFTEGCHQFSFNLLSLVWLPVCGVLQLMYFILQIKHQAWADREDTNRVKIKYLKLRATDGEKWGSTECRTHNCEQRTSEAFPSHLMHRYQTNWAARAETLGPLTATECRFFSDQQKEPAEQPAVTLLLFSSSFTSSQMKPFPSPFHSPLFLALLSLSSPAPRNLAALLVGFSSHLGSSPVGCCRGDTHVNNPRGNSSPLDDRTLSLL